MLVRRALTPDNGYIMGEAPELRNFFVAAGLNSSGVASAAGAGKAMAEWITEWGHDDGPLRGGHQSFPGLGQQSHIPAGSHRRDPGPGLRHAPGLTGNRKRLGTCAGPLCTNASFRREPASGSLPDGSGRTGTLRRGWIPFTSTPGGDRTGFPTPPVSTWR